MLKAQFLIPLVILSILHTSCFSRHLAESGKSFFELNGFLQETLFGYKAFGRHGNSLWHCPFTCGDVWSGKMCSPYFPDNRTSCNGKIISVSDERVSNACILREGPRKLKWIEGEYGPHLGEPTWVCHKEEGHLLFDPPKFEGYYREEYGCRAQCFQDQWRIYLGRLTSNESDNCIIVGVRFKLKGHMIFIQPAQGKLGTDGRISNISWVQLPKVIPEKEIGNINLTHRSFFIEELELDLDYVLTGVQFNVVERGNDKIKGFAVSISGRLLNFESGQLDLTPRHYQVGKASASVVQKELPLKLVKPPPEAIYELPESSQHEYTYVKLQQSDIVADVGQTTLPLFDSTPVLVQRNLALSGIRILHKGSKDHAGFISLQVLPFTDVPFLKYFLRIYNLTGTEIVDTEIYDETSSDITSVEVDYL